MRISDWSSDVCSSDLSSPRPTPKSSFTWSVIQFPFATPTPVRWVSPAALPILRAALRLLALPKRLPLRVLPLDPAVGGAAGYAGRGSAGRLEQVIAGEANASDFGHQHPLFQQLLAHAVVAVALEGRHGVQAAARTGQHHEAFLGIEATRIGLRGAAMEHLVRLLHHLGPRQRLEYRVAERRQENPDRFVQLVRSEEHTSELQSLMRISY